MVGQAAGRIARPISLCENRWDFGRTTLVTVKMTTCGRYKITRFCEH